MDLRKQILDIGSQRNDGLLSEDEFAAKVHDVRKANHLSEKKMKKFLIHERAKMYSKIAPYEKQIVELEREAQKQRAAVDLLEAAQKDVEPTGGFIRRFRETCPDIWSEVAQRIYKNVDAYGNYQFAYLEWGWAHFLSQVKKDSFEVPPPPLQDSLDAFAVHKQHGFPFFFVSLGICDAAWQSDLKFTVDWKTMHLPFEAFTFVLPKSNPVGHEAIIVYRRVKDGDMKLTFVTLGKKALGEDIDIPFPFDASDDISMSISERETARWVFNTIYAMSSRPEYIEGGERVGRYKQTQSEVWTPNIIGRKYAVKSTSFPNEKKGSVRLHWRRGHFRQQAYGIGRTQHRVIWIEPMMVGGQTK